MKQGLFKIACILLVMLAYLPASAGDPYAGFIPSGPHLSLDLQPIHIYDEEPELPDNGMRDNPERIPALISENGVAIERVSESEIESYDIYTPSGILLDSFGSGEEFATSLFSLKGEYEVRFTTSEYIYVGYVWME